MSNYKNISNMSNHKTNNKNTTNETQFKYQNLGISILIDLHNGYTLFASANHNGEKTNSLNNGATNLSFYDVCIAIADTSDKCSLPVFNTIKNDLELIADKKNVKSMLFTYVLNLYKTGKLDTSIEETKIMQYVLNNSEEFIDSIELDKLDNKE